MFETEVRDYRACDTVGAGEDHVERGNMGALKLVAGSSHDGFTKESLA